MTQPRYLLDTNICIYIRRERPKGVLKRFKTLVPGSTAISVVTYGELIYGVRRSDDSDRATLVLQELTALIPVLPMASDVAKAYGTIRGDLAARGQLIGNNDLWIAAHAKSLELTLVTNNENEFRRVDGLTIENWAKE
ncbi:type II toxin-antitoxin system tRNA(fMet)-specific endonuclease VapC [Microvirga tunisiensis]|uniref:Ribonuclease VapC n=1 Tax=Microvirga tunisiensis TaxID=2108360 RepID=A0A5N7MUC7_9HYPH|nr:type II toxin-antitoxin system VapC family toxin [Microvirga tunisiensis]MPR12640.1 type II toxin-antitoxin system VapC family toxin [Microvirga tunisiensis]MPR30582.1 type II toxin-antitoxin system VapC family toxin [Microvirga tunisiensis]